MDIAERVKRVIEIHLGQPPEKITPEANLIDDLAMDSLDAVELVMAAEEEFGREIADDEAEKWITVQDAMIGIESICRKRPRVSVF